MEVKDKISFEKVCRKKKMKNLIIMPMYKEYDYIELQLGVLSKQTVQDFDVIIVLNEVTDENRVYEIVDKAEGSYGIIVVKRKTDTGAAGAFWIGEKYAIENGYSNVILGESDAIPLQKDLIEILIAESKSAEAVAPKCQIVYEDKIIFESTGPHFYWLITTEMLKKVGLHYEPLYLGSEDRHLVYRIMEHGKIKHIDARVSHPYANPIFANFPKSIKYRIGHMIVSAIYIPKEFFFNILILLPVFFLFGTAVVRKGANYILSSLSKLEYGKELDFGKEPLKKENCIADWTITPIKCKGNNEIQFNREKNNEILEILPRLFRKKVLLHPTATHFMLLTMIVAKETWVKTRGGYSLMAENNSIVVHVLRMIVFVAALPAMLMVGLVLLLYIRWKKPLSR